MKDQPTIPYKINYPNLRKVWTNPKISPGAKVILWSLIQRGGKNGRIFPSQKTLASEIGRSTRQVYNYLEELKKHKVITAWGKNEFSASNYYEINPEIYFLDVQIMKGESQKQASSDTRNIVPEEYSNIFPPNNNQVNNTYLTDREAVDESPASSLPVKDNKKDLNNEGCKTNESGKSLAKSPQLR